MPPWPPMPAYLAEWRVLKRAQVMRDSGHIMDGGATRNRLATPPTERPMSWVEMTRSHWSSGRKRSRRAF